MFQNDSPIFEKNKCKYLPLRCQTWRHNLIISVIFGIFWNKLSFKNNSCPNSQLNWPWVVIYRVRFQNTQELHEILSAWLFYNFLSFAQRIIYLTSLIRELFGYLKILKLKKIKWFFDLKKYCFQNFEILFL